MDVTFKRLWGDDPPSFSKYYTQNPDFKITSFSNGTTSEGHRSFYETLLCNIQQAGFRFVAVTSRLVLVVIRVLCKSPAADEPISFFGQLEMHTTFTFFEFES